MMGKCSSTLQNIVCESAKTYEIDARIARLYLITQNQHISKALVIHYSLFLNVVLFILHYWVCSHPFERNYTDHAL